MADVGGFEKFINFIIPAALLIIALAWTYFKFKEPVNSFFLWAKETFSSSADKIKDTTIVQSKDIVINY